MNTILAFWHDYPGSTPEMQPPTDYTAVFILLGLIACIIICTQTSAANTRQQISRHESRKHRR